MSKSKLLIGISGKMCVGKSTISHMLQAAFKDNSDNKVGILSLASPIYKAQDLIYNEYDIKVQGDKDRELLIAIGIWGRNKHPDFWLGQFAKLCKETDLDIIICDDVRFENEAEFFKNNGMLFRIEGEQRGSNIDTSKATDPTECGLDNYKFEHVITNNKEPTLMCQEIAQILLGK